MDIVVVALFLFLALRQHLFVDSHAVNVMFWDQWDFISPSSMAEDSGTCSPASTDRTARAWGCCSPLFSPG